MSADTPRTFRWSSGIGSASAWIDACYVRTRIEDTSIQVELGFTAALAAEGLLAGVDARHDDWLVNISDDEQARPVLLAVSDNGIQMTSGSTRGFMALCAIAQHFGRPGTPTDQAPIESVNGHIKLEYPHLLAPATLRTEIALTATAKGSTGKSATPPTPEKATATRGADAVQIRRVQWVRSPSLTPTPG